MKDEVGFSTWKDFAFYVLDKLECVKEEKDALEKEVTDLKEDFIKLKTQFYTIGAIVIVILGIFEIAIRI